MPRCSIPGDHVGALARLLLVETVAGLLVLGEAHAVEVLVGHLGLLRRIRMVEGKIRQGRNTPNRLARLRMGGERRVGQKPGAVPP